MALGRRSRSASRHLGCRQLNRPGRPRRSPELGKPNAHRRRGVCCGGLSFGQPPRTLRGLAPVGVAAPIYSCRSWSARAAGWNEPRSSAGTRRPHGPCSFMSRGFVSTGCCKDGPVDSGFHPVCKAWRWSVDHFLLWLRVFRLSETTHSP